MYVQCSKRTTECDHHGVACVSAVRCLLQNTIDYYYIRSPPLVGSCSSVSFFFAIVVVAQRTTSWCRTTQWNLVVPTRCILYSSMNIVKGFKRSDWIKNPNYHTPYAGRMMSFCFGGRFSFAAFLNKYGELATKYLKRTYAGTVRYMIL